MIDEARTEAITSDWYQSLVDDIIATTTERIFNARQEVLYCYHEIGKRLVLDEEYQRYSHGNGKMLSRVSKDTDVSERDLYRSIQFYNLFPDPDDWPEGKNLSWHKVVNRYLTDGGNDKPARTFQQRKESIKGTLDKFVEDFPDMPKEIKIAALELLALFDERYYDVV